MSINRKRGSIALARSLCYQINGAADDSDDIDGSGYGSVDVAEILSAEIERLRKVLAQPEQEPCIGKDPQCPCQDGDACHYKDSGGTKALPVPPEQEPVAFYHPRSGFYWAKPTSIFAPTSVDVEPLPLYAAAERNNG